MSTEILKDMVALVVTWPVAAQEELIGIAHAMDTAMKGGMGRQGTGDTMIVPTMVEVPRITDAERTELLASLEENTADSATGRFHVLKPGDLRTEFEAIMRGDPSDAELDALLGIDDTQSPERR